MDYYFKNPGAKKQGPMAVAELLVAAESGAMLPTAVIQDEMRGNPPRIAKDYKEFAVAFASRRPKPSSFFLTLFTKRSSPSEDHYEEKLRYGWAPVVLGALGGALISLSIIPPFGVSNIVESDPSMVTLLEAAVESNLLTIHQERLRYFWAGVACLVALGPLHAIRSIELSLRLLAQRQAIKEKKVPDIFTFIVVAIVVLGISFIISLSQYADSMGL